MPTDKALLKYRKNRLTEEPCKFINETNEENDLVGLSLLVPRLAPWHQALPIQEMPGSDLGGGMIIHM